MTNDSSSPLADADKALKRANRRNNGEGVMRAAARSHDLLRIKANLRPPVSPSTVATSEPSDRSFRSPHRLLEAKANLSRMNASSCWDSHRFSIESLVDQEDQVVVDMGDTVPPHHDLLQAKYYIRNSQGTLTSANDTVDDGTTIKSRETVEWVNNDVSAEYTVSDYYDDDMAQGANDECPMDDIAVATLTAVVVNEEEELQRFEMQSRRDTETSTIRAEVVDLKKRGIIIKSCVMAALLIIGSLVVVTSLVTSKNRRNNKSPAIDYIQDAEWIDIALAVSETNITYPPPENASTVETAVAWLIEESVAVPDSKAVQRFAFIVMALTWKNPEWNLTADFDECDQKGVTCNAEDSCIEMDLTAHGLVGTIPPEIALLTDMRKLVLWGNSLTGPVPWEPMLERMTEMNFLDLDDNKLTGTMPSPWPGTWPLLTIFWVAKNEITGTISPGFANWPVLEDLYVRDNLLTGTIPSELGAISTLNWFSVDDNDLHGTLPTEIGGWTDINHFEVEGSGRLTGTIPTEVGRWTAVRDFFCHMNKFNGTLPTEIGAWSNSIVRFRADFNDFTGTLPYGMTSWTNLLWLHVNNNGFVGQLPAGITNWTALEEIQLNNNRFSGTIPSGLESWEDLKHGYFQVNDFDGSVDELCPDTSSGPIITADCCEVACPCCSSCFADNFDPNCTSLGDR